MKTTAMNPDYDSVAAYAKLGWVPCDKENESVSKTLEYAYDDYCIAQMAKALGKQADYEYFMKRAGSFQNLFDPSVGLMRGKDSQGRWRTPFDPHLYVEGGDFTEGTSWQYSWYVPQDVPGLISLMGGKEKFAQKLDKLFTFGPNESKGMSDVQGRIGEYWHGNEPSHHIIYLYCYAGQPWKAQQRLHEVMQDAVRQQAQFAYRQRRLRADVGLVHLHRPGFLSRLPRQRLLRDRQPRAQEGRGASFQRQDVHDGRPRTSRTRTSTSSRSGSTARTGTRRSCPTRIEGRRRNRVYDGAEAE